MVFVVAYVDGSLESSADWSELRRDGVDWILAGRRGRAVKFASASVYWAYEEGGAWVVGRGPVGYDRLPDEVVFLDDGEQERPIKFMPDLKHEQVKLGWWWRDGEDVLAP